MTALTQNFQLEEFEPSGPMPVECIPCYESIAVLLEKVRAQFKQPIEITSGYRSPEDNAASHGALHSQHVATASYAAADWYIQIFMKDMRPVFDWIRETSGLTWDQLVLEHDLKTGNDVIHLSWSKTCRREALEGQTFNAGPYKSWPVGPANAVAV